MASRPRNVDLGPLYLQIGQEDALQGWTPPASGAPAGDVARFESLLRRGGGRPQDEVELPPEALLGPMREPEAAALAETSDIGAEVAHLWVGTGLRSGREVRVGLRGALLPDTSVHLYESQGRLRIEFGCASASVALWLQRRLRPLAAELGDRLGRELEVSVSMSDGSLVGSRTWRRGL